MGRTRKVRVPNDQLGQAVHEALQGYAEDALDVVRGLSRKYAKQGATDVKNASKSTFGGSGEYASGWTSSYEETRYSGQGIIYNKQPGLPHLLEHGHANRNGGRTPGRAHIAPVEERIAEEFEKAVKEAL